MNFLEKDLKKVNSIDEKTSATPVFNQKEHDSTSRLEVTKLILTWYFRLIAGSFIFVLAYNLIIGLLNYNYFKEHPITYIELTPTVSIITTTLNGIIGFVIGYYFKNKDE